MANNVCTVVFAKIVLEEAALHTSRTVAVHSVQVNGKETKNVVLVTQVNKIGYIPHG